MEIRTSTSIRKSPGLKSSHTEMAKSMAQWSMRNRAKTSMRSCLTIKPLSSLAKCTYWRNRAISLKSIKSSGSTKCPHCACSKGTPKTTRLWSIIQLVQAMARPKERLCPLNNRRNNSKGNNSRISNSRRKSSNNKRRRSNNNRRRSNSKRSSKNW